MAAFSTVISEFSDQENRRTYAVTGHTVQAPKLVIQKRIVPKTLASAAGNELMVVYGTVDAQNVVLGSKVVMTASVRYPANGTSTAVTAALAVFRDLVASDEFTAMVTGQAYIR